MCTIRKITNMSTVMLNCYVVHFEKFTQYTYVKITFFSNSTAYNLT